MHSKARDVISDVTHAGSTVMALRIAAVRQDGKGRIERNKDGEHRRGCPIVAVLADLADGHADRT